MYDDGDTDTNPVSTDGVVTRPSATITASSRSYDTFSCIDGLRLCQHPQSRASRVQRTLIFLTFTSSNCDDRLLQNQYKCSDDRWLGRGCRCYPRAHWRACLVFPGTKTEAPNLASGSGTVPRARSPAIAPISPFRCTAYIHGSDHAGTLITLPPTLRCDELRNLQFGRQVNPQQSASSHAVTHSSFVMEPNSSRVISQERIIHSPSNSLSSSTVPPNPQRISNLGDPSSVPEAHQGPRVDKNRRLRIPRPSRQGTTAETAPPTRLYTNLATTQAQPPNEPIEERVIVRQLSRSTLPPYSPGGFLHDEDVPPMPGQ